MLQAYDLNVTTPPPKVDNPLSAQDKAHLEALDEAVLKLRPEKPNSSRSPTCSRRFFDPG